MPNKIRLPILTGLILLALLQSLTAVQVVSVSPAANVVQADRLPIIEVTFAAPIAPTTVTGESFMVFGRWSGVMSGTFSFDNNDTVLRFTPETPFSAGEYVTVYLAKDISDASLQPSERQYAWSFWTKAEPGSMALVEIDRIAVRQSGEGWIQTYGAYAGDLNEDGYTDFSVPNERSDDVRVFLNDGNGGYGNFTIHSMPNGNTPSTNEGSDFNLDGHIDFCVGNIGNNQVTVFLGDGTGGFLSIAGYPAGQSIRGITVLDANGDGYCDIVSANATENNLALLMNNGDGTFADPVFLESGGDSERAIAAADADNDGFMDLIVGARESKEIIVMRGDSLGNFTVAGSVAAGGRPWMIAVGDVDGDGNVDAAAVIDDLNQAVVYRGDGNGGFSAGESYPAAQFPLAIDLGDLDGDGDLDMIASCFNGVPDGVWWVFENDGTGSFINPTAYPAQDAASCAIFHDRDNDGDLDVTGIDEIADLLILFENNLVGITGEPSRGPVSFRLDTNYPNPFNPTTVIGYQLSVVSEVELAVYNLLGQRVRTLVSGRRPAGEYSVTWDGRNEAGHLQSTGIYLYRLTVGGGSPGKSDPGFSETRKMILIR